MIAQINKKKIMRTSLKDIRPLGMMALLMIQTTIHKNQDRNKAKDKVLKKNSKIVKIHKYRISHKFKHLITLNSFNNSKNLLNLKKIKMMFN